ncbi:LysR family transcriptional regulator [Pelomonas sp. Root1217]|uniref:LysR family transcriptional regulator n=1 Tax=Pelomonas sp. Root1217 TaxID=1736430 RepID=UPI00070E65C9|nr:LysR family transcriptional regulator [Pelomonas sp. Root1217]KQV53246.1 LysR family transcriptional regulator [Pelomonas sp. Root1217]
MDRFEAMTVFVAIAEAGSLSAAARKLEQPLATVSRKLTLLEAQLKTRLIARSTRRLELTDAGRDYLEASRQILEQVADAERAAAGAYARPHGRLVISAPVVFGRLHLLPLIVEFLREFPDVDVRLIQADRVVNLLEEHVDLALRIGELADSGLVATKVGEIRRVCCASPAYLAAYGRPSAPADLARHACISFEGLMSASRWVFPAETVEIRSRLAVTTAEAAIAAAEQGLGVARVLSYQVADAVQAGRLERLLPEHEPAPVPVSLIYPGQGRLPMKCRAFLDYAAPRLRERLQGQASAESAA